MSVVRSGELKRRGGHLVTNMRGQELNTPNHASSTAERRRETERQEYGKQTKEILFLRLAGVELVLESKKIKKRGDLGFYQDTKPRRNGVCSIFPLFFLVISLFL